MSIRLRMLLTFFGLVFVGVMAISSYSILFVRDYLLSSSRDDLDRQARFLATLLVNQADEGEYPAIMADHARYTGHMVELLAADLQVRVSAGAIEDTTAPTFSGIAPLPGAATQERRYVRITASEAAIRGTLRRVRYLIYGGIFGALLLTAAIGWVVADRLTDPIRRLASAARDVARGEPFRLPRSVRKDELGDLSRDVAAMAGKLQEDIQDLRRLNQAQEDFIAALSHEVRNPVFSARGYLEMALVEHGAQADGSDDDARMLEYLQKTHRNLLRIHNLFADMLLLVRLEFDREAPALAALPLGPVVSELEETFLPQAQERGIALAIQGKGQTVRGNAEVLKIALSNLLGNAIQHTTEGEVRLDIAPVDGGGVRLEVTDTGEGIPAEELESIFDKFHRVDKARSREAGGTGLGLALVKQCMVTLGSEIRVDSTMGKGSRFWFDLPAADGT